jgi:hypothetical protein
MNTNVIEDQGNRYEFEVRVLTMDDGWSAAIKRKQRHLRDSNEISLILKWVIPKEECHGMKDGYKLAYALYSMHAKAGDYAQAVKHAQDAQQLAPKWAKAFMEEEVLKARVKAGDLSAINDAIEYYLDDMHHIISYTEEWLDLAIKADDYRFLLDIVISINDRMSLIISGKVKPKLPDQPTSNRKDMKKRYQYFLARLSSKRGFLVEKLALQNMDRASELSRILDLIDQHKKNSGAKIEKLRQLISEPV